MTAAAIEPTESAAVGLDDLGGRICMLAGRLAQATYHFLAMIAEFDRRGGWGGVGIKSGAHWLAWTCSMAPGTAREHVRVARALEELPLVSAEMAAGRLSYSKVREITRVSDRTDEASLVEFARTATASQLARAVRAVRRAEGDRGRQEQQRCARWFTDADGSVVLTARLPAEEGAVVVAALEAARDELWRAENPEVERAEAERSGQDRAGVDRAGEDRAGEDHAGTQATEDQSTSAGRIDRGCADMTDAPPVSISSADALVHCARRYLQAAPGDESGEDRTSVVVHVSAEHLVGAPPTRSRGNAEQPRAAVATDCCEVAGIGGIEPDTARRLSCDAILLGVIRGRGGTVLAHGRRRRLVSAPQRRALMIRDGHCRFPGCQRTSHLEAHHVMHWARGGRTDMDNLILLCRFHHVACHEGGVELVATPESTSAHPQWLFRTAQGDPMLGVRLPDGTEGWRGDSWILWHGLDGHQGWNDPFVRAIRPTWAGERVSLDDMVRALFDFQRRWRDAENDMRNGTSLRTGRTARRDANQAANRDANQAANQAANSDSAPGSRAA